MDRIDQERYAREALARGLYIVKQDGARVPIRPSLEPTLHDLKAETAASQVLLQAAARAAERLRIEDLGATSEMERACLVRRRERGAPLRLATARVDFLGGKALEINTTIPAMQGYADIVVEALLAAAGVDDAEALLARNGRNTDDLLAALQALAGGAARTIGIVAREGDAQQGELLHYVSRFRALGVRALLVTPDEVRLGPGGRLRCAGVPVDILYRHIFSWRVPRESDLGRALLDAEEHGIANPVALDLEAKSTLAELSRAADAGEGWLTREERAVIRALVPWTRRLDQEVAAQVLSDPARYVLKRSWDYGGKAVHLGIETPPPRWQELVTEALRPGDVWVAQERVDLQTEERTLLPDAKAPAYVDLSAFTSLGLDRAYARGGASRVSPRRIVNILGGGGLAPLLRPEVADLLYTGRSG